MDMQLLLFVWAAIVVAYVTVALMRWIIGRREDDHLHFADSEQQLLATQTSVAHKLDVLDRWKTALLILTVLSAIVIAALHAYVFWHDSAARLS